MAEFEDDDPYGLSEPRTVELRDRALAKRSFQTKEERREYIEGWNAKWIAKRKRTEENRAAARQKAAAARKEAAADAAVREEAAVPPPVPPARRKRRHWGLLTSFLILVALPVTLAVWALYVMAEDQYASTTAFTVRSDETSTATELLGGLSGIVNTGAGGNADVLFEYIHSQELVEAVDTQLDLVGHYSVTWESDPLFSLWPEATIEDLQWFWNRMVRITYDKGSGLLMVEVRARDPEYAREVARLVVRESEAMINTLNAAARRDSMANARAELDESLTRLSTARTALAGFRARTQILDPLADIQGRMGVLNNLQQQLAETYVESDLLSQSVDSTDPRLRQLERRIEVIESRIIEERKNFAANNVTVDNTDYPALLAQYESLLVDQEFAEQTYRAALTAMDAARSNAERQQLYLATYIRPTLAQRAEYPQRLLLVGLVLFFSLLVWAILALVYYSLRDRG